MGANNPLGVIMRLLLLNNNPAVSRLIKLSVDKVGYEMDEFEDYGLVPLKAYDVIMVDNECYEEEELRTLCEHSSCEYVVYICQRGSKKPDFVNVALEKPFLPTDFLLLLEKIKKVLESLKPQAQTEETFAKSEAIHEVVPSNVFDIDAIDTFGVESLDNDALNPLEEIPLEEDELDEESLLEELDEEDALDLPLFDIQEDEDENETLDLASIKTEEDEDEEERVLSPFDFEEKPLFSEPLDALDEESAPCILDRDDINEVKQLLDESDDEEAEAGEDETFNLESPVFEEGSLEEELALEEESEDEDPFVLDEVSLKTEEFALPEEDAISEEEIEEETNEASLDEIPFMETQEELINDFEESVEERIEAEENIAPLVDITLARPLVNAVFESIDDLNENAIKKAFGEEVDEELMEESTDLDDASAELKDAQVIRGEIENTIARSLSGLAQSDVLREALKGMRINISITFDEKN